MHAPTIHHRYAAALLEIGLEQKKIHDQLGRDLDRVAALTQGAKELRELFRNPKFGGDVRKSVLKELLSRVKVSSVTRNFLNLLIDRNRIGNLPRISAAYRELADETVGRVRAEVTVSAPMHEKEVQRLRAVLSRLTGREVVVEQREDSTILGGVITKVQGRVYDGSIRAQLERLRGQLKAASA